MPIHFFRLNRNLFSPKPIFPEGKNSEIIREAQREIIRQARHSYDLYAVGIAASTLLSITAGVLVLTNRLPEAGATALTGIGIVTYSNQAHKDSQEKLSELLESLKEVSKG